MIFNCKRIFILLILLFLTLADVRAGNAYKNELIRVSLTPIGSGDVKVTLYMAKPYSEPLRLLKKNEEEFVLILPETYSSAPQKPSISDVISEITNADIKLYPFISNTSENGYTKIVIKTNGFVNLYPEAVAIGGGSLAKSQSQVNSIISEQLKQNSQTPQYQISQNQIPQTSKPENKIPAANTPQTKINVPEISNKTSIKSTVKEDKNQKIKEQKSVKKEIKPEKQKTNTILKAEEPIEQTNKTLEPETTVIQPKAEEVTQKPIEPIEAIETETYSVSFIQKIKTKLSNMIFLVKNYVSEFKNELPSRMGNILTILATVLLVGFSIKFAISVLKNAGQKQADDKNSQSQNKQNYSKFFKNIIEAETNTNNKNIPKILSEKRDYMGVEVEPSKSHKEILSEDQNLTWQDKFRALQINRKSLLKDKGEEFSKKNIFQTENIENMTIDNPIKKLTQDFRSVRRVLEKHAAAQNNQTSIKQDFTPEKIENIEVISFEDLSKNVEKPKIQVSTTKPIKVKTPKILTKLDIENNKGLYLVDYNGKISLLGYINDKIFKLNSYSSVKIPKLYARLIEKNKSANTYIVKIDNSKLLVDVNDEEIKLKLMY